MALGYRHLEVRKKKELLLSRAVGPIPYPYLPPSAASR
jgi:hypothetical protein